MNKWFITPALTALLLLCPCRQGIAQIPSATSHVMKAVQSNSTTISFELWFKNTSADVLQYYVGQYFFDFNKAILRGDAELKIAASGLPQKYQPCHPMIDTVSSPGMLMFATNQSPHTKFGFPIAGFDSVLVLRAQLSCKAGFNEVPLDLLLCGSQKSLKATTIFAYIKDGPKNISRENLIINDNVSLVITGIKTNDRKLIPETFSMQQNYPNPFNPVSTISYQLPVACRVTLKVYDILGKEVVTLENAEKPAGYYSARFNGTALASGIYIYRLTAQGLSKSTKFISVKKMLLIK
jgi:hypothetical protein